MFEIGNSLREARVRQGLELGAAEQATKIRSKYLRALEDEQFDVLPAQTYVKGFLRNYAEFLGLDGQLYVDEFNSRYATGEEDYAPTVGGSSAASLGHRRIESNGVLIALGTIGLVSALVIVAWKFGGDKATDNPLPNPTPAPRVNQNVAPTSTRRNHRAARRPRVARLVVSARDGSCWLEVRNGSPTGTERFQGTLDTGQSKTFSGRRLWINFGAPSNVALRLNGKPASLPRGTLSPATVYVMPRRITTAPSA